MIDAHFHAWRLIRGDYGWLTPALKPIYRDVTIDDWASLASSNQITGGILVQAAPTFEETQFLLQQANLNPMVKGVIGWIDMLSADAVDKVAWCAQEPRLKGLRPMLQDLEDPDWILQAQVQPVLHAMAKEGLVLDALIKPDHLSRILEISQRHASLSIVIDHGAKPKIQNDELLNWQNQMAQLAKATQDKRVMCKLSGLWTEAPCNTQVEALKPWCEALLEIWTPQRLIWGSDWPVLELAGNYAEWRHFSLKLLERYTPEEQALILGANAQNMYKL